MLRTPRILQQRKIINISGRITVYIIYKAVFVWNPSTIKTVCFCFLSDYSGRTIEYARKIRACIILILWFSSILQVLWIAHTLGRLVNICVGLRAQKAVGVDDVCLPGKMNLNFLIILNDVPNTTVTIIRFALSSSNTGYVCISCTDYNFEQYFTIKQTSANRVANAPTLGRVLSQDVSNLYCV